MQYRGFIQLALIVLATACFAIGMVATVTALMVFALAIELIVWTDVLKHKNPTNEDTGSVV